MAGEVFISHSRSDRAYVEKLVAHLKGAGVPVWYDYQIATGERFKRIIQRQLDACSAVVVLATPAAIASEWVELEIGYAKDHGKPILPLLRAGRDLPLRIRNLHYEDVTGGWRRTSTVHDPKATPAPDLVQRHFTASAPNRLWVADATRIPCGEKVFWLAAVRDAFSNGSWAGGAPTAATPTWSSVPWSAASGRVTSAMGSSCTTATRGRVELHLVPFLATLVRQRDPRLHEIHRGQLRQRPYGRTSGRP